MTTPMKSPSRKRSSRRSSSLEVGGTENDPDSPQPQYDSDLPVGEEEDLAASLEARAEWYF